MGVPRARLFSRVARRAGALQTNRHRRAVGAAPAAHHARHLHRRFLAPRESELRIDSVSTLRPRGTFAVATLLECIRRSEQLGRFERAARVEGLLPAADHADQRDDVIDRRFRRVGRDARGAVLLVSRAGEFQHSLARSADDPLHRDGAGRRDLVRGASRSISRHSSSPSLSEMKYI